LFSLVEGLVIEFGESAIKILTGVLEK